MKESDTPRTDAAWPGHKSCPVEFAQKFERELAQAMKENDGLANLLWEHPTAPCDQDSVFESMQRVKGLRDELDQLKAESERVQKQFGICSVCGNCAWVTRPDGVTEDCEFCKLRSSVQELEREINNLRG
jgi:hypothetical protein